MVINIFLQNKLIRKMSYMSLLEKKLRYSTAYSLLNNIRHKIEKRPDSVVTERDISILNEAIELIIGEVQQRITKTVIYSLQNMEDIFSSSALELSEAMEVASTKLNPKPEVTDYYSLLRKVIINEILTEREQTQILKFINLSMQIIEEKKNNESSLNEFSHDL